jgi:NAD(P)-dependent dehydrogenase (short-subunit alcohol dehydrogenase family)
MSRLDGRVAIVTGAGSGLGREHALFLAGQGASVLVNDLGGTVHGEGRDSTAAQAVADEIVAAGGMAVPSGHDVSDWNEASDMVQAALDAFGELDVLVNNAGILRDRTMANMTEAEWDAVIRVHLRGHAAPTQHALAHWRDRAKDGKPVTASVVHTTSIAGFVGNFGQANYSAAKAAVLGLSAVVALEGPRYGVRSNAVSPSARTRLTLAVPGAEAELRPPEDPKEFDRLHPGNVSPLIGWLAEAECPANGQVFHISGSRLLVMSMPSIVHDLRTEGRWTLAELDRQLASKLLRPAGLEEFIER